MSEHTPETNKSEQIETIYNKDGSITYLDGNEKLVDVTMSPDQIAAAKQAYNESFSPEAEERRVVSAAEKHLAETAFIDSEFFKIVRSENTDGDQPV